MTATVLASPINSSDLFEIEFDAGDQLFKDTGLTADGAVLVEVTPEGWVIQLSNGGECLGHYFVPRSGGDPVRVELSV